MMDYRNNYNNENETNNENMMAAEQNSFNGKKPSSKNKKAAKLAKKIGAIALSAVLFGGVAGGTFQAVNHFAGSTTATATTTTAQQTTSNSSLLKAAATSSSSTSTGTMDVSTIVKNAMPSIVSITNQSVQEVQNYFSMFGYGAQTPQTEETTSCGSGIIIGKNDTELLIVTNNHVVKDADTLSVSFVNNQVCKANIKGTDADNDLAVIAVPLSEIPDASKEKTRTHQAFKPPELGVELTESAFRDWMTVRKAKHSPLTETAWKHFKAQVLRSELSIQQAVELCATKGWISINAEWQAVKDYQAEFDSRSSNDRKVDFVIKALGLTDNRKETEK